MEKATIHVEEPQIRKSASSAVVTAHQRPPKMAAVHMAVRAEASHRSSSHRYLSQVGDSGTLAGSESPDL
jgi:ribosomal protein L21